MKAKKVLSWIGGVLAVILLGSIANGVWSGILLPVLSWLTDTIIRFLGSISGALKDWLYVEAARGLNESYSVQLIMFMLGGVIGVMCSLITWFHFLRRHPKEKIAALLRSKRQVTIMYILGFTVIVVSILMAMRVSYVHRITEQSFNSLEIIAPFVDQKAHLSLRSEFLRIRDANDYERFYEKMVGLSKEHNIELPLFKPL